ncbi:hypothetical protein L1049_016349 [Liquidambar formosana]|uniref:Uncharacterized protein n=1 Tax=Liquidambar formosana TaxID=63359 RepID=A0AAP0X7H1_LIQFO
MDMDIDIPLPEELEWLEANSHPPEDFEEPEPPDFYPEEDEPPPPPPPPPSHQSNPQPPKSLLSIPAKPTLPPHPKPPPRRSTDPPLPSTTQPNGQKRPRSDNPNSSNSIDTGSSEDKRSRIDDVGPETDEDWLRYLPPKESDVHVVDQVVVEEEKIVSRFASEIDGDCIPVTGPSGDRVYAKMSRVEKKDG